MSHRGCGAGAATAAPAETADRNIDMTLTTASFFTFLPFIRRYPERTGWTGVTTITRPTD
ncbi:hypothetical protein GCM10029964_050560 [Kibdelosporangium lantanae]